MDNSKCYFRLGKTFQTPYLRGLGFSRGHTAFQAYTSAKFLIKMLILAQLHWPHRNELFEKLCGNVLELLTPLSLLAQSSRQGRVLYRES